MMARSSTKGCRTENAARHHGRFPIRRDNQGSDPSREMAVSESLLLLCCNPTTGTAVTAHRTTSIMSI